MSVFGCEMPGSCAAECAGPADVGRSLEQEDGAPRAVLELVSYDWEESYLRAPRPGTGEEPCANGCECQGVSLVRDGFARPPEGALPASAAGVLQGFTLVQFRTPEQARDDRPPYRSQLCLLCMRNRVTWTWMRNIDSGAPESVCIIPHRVVAGPGGYAPGALLPTGGPGRFVGVTDAFPRHHYSQFRLLFDSDTQEWRLSQRPELMRFSPTPHRVLAPFEAHGGAGWFVLRTEQPFEVVEALMDEWTAKWPTVSKLACDDISQRRTAVRAFQAAWFDARVEPIPELWRAVMFGWNGVRTPYRTPRHIRNAALTRALASAMPFPGPMAGRGASQSKLMECVRLVPTFFAGVVRAAFLAPAAQAAFARVFALAPAGPDAAAVELVRDHPALTLLALRAHLVRLITADGMLRRFLRSVHGNKWSTFEYCVERGLVAARAALEDKRSLADVERAVVASHAKSAGGPPPALNPSRGWFWDVVAVETKGTFEAHARALGAEEKLQAPAFDARGAYDSVRAVCRAAGASPEARALLLELERAHEVRDMRAFRCALRDARDAAQATALEVALIATTVHDSFGVRLIRAPHHWAVHGARAKRRTYLVCPCCRRFKSHVAVSLDEWLRTKRGKTEDQGVAYLSTRTLDEGTIKVAYDPTTREFTCNPKQKSSKLREAAEDMDAAAELEDEDLGEAEEDAKPAKRRVVKVHRTVQRYTACTRTTLVPLDFCGNIVELYGRQYAQCWRCHIPREMDASTHGRTLFTCGWCQAPADAPAELREPPPPLQNESLSAPVRWSAVTQLQTRQPRKRGDAGRGGGEGGARKPPPRPRAVRCVRRADVQCALCAVRLVKAPTRAWKTVRCVRVPGALSTAECVDVAVCPKHRVPRWTSGTSVVAWGYLEKLLQGT